MMVYTEITRRGYPSAMLAISVSISSQPDVLGDFFVLLFNCRYNKSMGGIEHESVIWV